MHAGCSLPYLLLSEHATGAGICPKVPLDIPAVCGTILHSPCSLLSILYRAKGLFLLEQNTFHPPILIFCF